MADIINSPVGTMPTIPVDTGGKFTPGAAYAIDSAAQIINAAWNKGLDMKTDFTAEVASVAATIDGLIAGNSLDISAQQSPVPAITEPVVTIPTAIDITDITSTFGTEYADIISELSTQFTNFRTAYFPNDTAEYTAAENWISAALANPTAALPASVAAQIIGDDHARVTNDANRASDALTAKYAGMRFPLPSGALASGQLQIQQKSQDLMAESSRKVTMASLEQMRFVVDKALSLRTMAMSSALDYIKALTSGPDIASRLVGIGYDAQSKLISSVSQYYGARTEAAKVISSVNQFNASATQDAAVKNQAADLTLIEDKIKALMVQIQAIAQMATSLFNNVHASAGSNYSVNGT